MANRVRLLQWMRSRLNELADKIVEPKKEKRVLEAAYGKAEPLVRKIVETMFPPREMRVLQKYKAASGYKDVKVAFPNGSVEEFVFASDAAPTVPSDYDSRRQIYLADERAAAAVEAWRDALTAYIGERKTRLAAYHALIAGSSYLDEITLIWPEAEGAIPSNNLPIALNPEQIALVKSDVRERKAA